MSVPLRATRGSAVALLLFSGAIALVYEIVWTRQMALLIGASTPAVTIVLAVFMAGLATGAGILGRIADRTPSPLRLYALLEAGVGAYALALPHLLRLATPLYVRAAQPLEGQPLALGAARLATGVLLLAPPTILMGGTLPALLKAVVRRPDGLGIDLGALYTANLVGGAVGALAAAFLLIPALGVQGTVALAALGSLLIALGALSWPAIPSAAAAPASPIPTEATMPADRPPRGVLLAVVALSGFLTMSYEVLWTRILIFSFLSTVHAFAVILAVFLLGLVLGSATFTLAERRGRAGAGLLCSVQVAGALAVLALAPVGARADAIVETLSSHLGFTGSTFLFAMAVSAGLLMLIPATLMGVVFPLGSRLLMAGGEDSGAILGRAYAINTLGAVAGAIATGFALVPALGLKGSLLLLAGVQALGGCAPLPWSRLPPPRRLPLAGLSAAGLAAALAFVSRALTGPTPFETIPTQRVLAHRDDATASVTVATSVLGGRSLFIDGLEAAAADDRSGYMAMMGHVPMMIHPKPERALVVCFGTGTTAGAVLQHSDVRLDIVDLNRAVLDFADYFRDFNHGAPHDPRARVVIEDGRGFLLTSRESYDVITSEPMPPTFAGVASLYSREYYELARARLRPGGLVVQWLPFHIVSPVQACSILRSVQDVFPETSLWVHQGTGVIVARREGALTVDAPELRRRFARLEPELRRFGVPSVDAFLDMYALDSAAVRSLAQTAPPVTDDRPSLEYDRPRHRRARDVETHAEDELRSLAAVYSLRRRDVPLTGVTPAEVERLGAMRAAASHGLLGDLYLGVGLGQNARAEYDAGLSLSVDAQQRGMFLFALARLAGSEGNRAEALRLVDEALALEPANAAAAGLRETLAREP